MNIGRFFCVALPFALTVGSIIFLLVAALAGVADKSLYIFRLNLTDLSIDSNSVEKWVSNLSSRDLDIGLDVRADTKTTNITTADLGLGNVYDIGLWGYCYNDQNDKRHCTKAKFNWAVSALNTSYIENFGSAAGVKIDLPSDLTNALKAFKKVAKWTEVVYIAAFVALAVEIIFGIFSNFSRMVSCCTWIISWLAAVLVGASAGLSTAMAAVVVGAIKATAKVYGVKASINTRFLAVVWIATAFAIGAALFWVFTICCCKPEHRDRSSRKNRDSHAEKLLPSTGYAPLSNDQEMSGGNYSNQNQSQYGAPRYPSGAPRSDLAYEPYSHRA